MKELLSREEIDYEVLGYSLRDLLNFNEYMVLGAMRKAFAEQPGLCRCRFCVEDVYALALNSLPPRYIQESSVQTYLGSPNFLPEQEIRSKVDEAVRKVAERPNHNAA